MTKIFLFRIKAERPILHIKTLFKEDKSSNELIYSAVNENSTCETRKGQEWRIGNIENIDTDSIFFAFGKIVNNTSDKYDEDKRQFSVQEEERAPHTYIVIDLQHQLCAIMERTGIASPIHIAGNLRKLLDKTQTAEEYVVNFKIDPINNPDKFIEMIENAERISQFTIELGLPNPFDANEDFQKPVERAVREAKASKAKTVMTGDNLEKNILAELSRSAVATGNTVSAKIKLPRDGKPEKRLLSDNQAFIEEEGDMSAIKTKTRIFENIRNLYTRIRGTDGKS